MEEVMLMPIKETTKKAKEPSRNEMGASRLIPNEISNHISIIQK